MASLSRLFYMFLEQHCRNSICLDVIYLITYPLDKWRLFWKTFSISFFDFLIHFLSFPSSSFFSKWTRYYYSIFCYFLFSDLPLFHLNFWPEHWLEHCWRKMYIYELTVSNYLNAKRALILNWQFALAMFPKRTHKRRRFFGHNINLLVVFYNLLSFKQFASLATTTTTTSTTFAF